MNEESLMTVLIITKSDDNDSVTMVADAIAERGGRGFRLDTDRFPTEVSLIAEYNKSSERLAFISDAGELDSKEITAIWHRRLNIGGQIPASMDKQMRRASVGESQASLHGMLASISAFRIDPVLRIRNAEHKQLQIQVARKIGLDTPRTLTTNDPAAVRNFAKSCETGIIAKMLSSFAIYEDGLEKVVFTNPVAPEDLEDLSGLRYSPMTFQEMVPKSLELRVTVVGTSVFSASIDSQSSERATYDWRRDGVAMVEDWKDYDLPKDVEARVLQLMDYFGLNYGAIDIIATPDGRHVFLEVNPVGEFFWLEKSPGLPISKAIADVLLGRAPRREHAASYNG